MWKWMITSFYKQFSRQPKFTRFTRFLSLSRSKNALSEIFGLEHVDGTYDDALKRWFELGKIEMAPENEM